MFKCLNFVNVPSCESGKVGLVCLVVSNVDISSIHPMSKSLMSSMTPIQEYGRTQDHKPWKGPYSYLCSQGGSLWGIWRRVGSCTRVWRCIGPVALWWEQHLFYSFTHVKMRQTEKILRQIHMQVLRIKFTKFEKDNKKVQNVEFTKQKITIFRKSLRSEKYKNLL